MPLGSTLLCLCVSFALLCLCVSFASKITNPESGVPHQPLFLTTEIHFISTKKTKRKEIYLVPDVSPAAVHCFVSRGTDCKTSRNPRGRMLVSLPHCGVKRSRQGRISFQDSCAPGLGSLGGGGACDRMAHSDPRRFPFWMQSSSCHPCPMPLPPFLMCCTGEMNRTPRWVICMHVEAMIICAI